MQKSIRSGLRLGASIASIVTALGIAPAFAADNTAVETVVVTGYKASLDKAIDMKRDALDSSDTILAEDIAKFPDLNLSESIQRIPGVALTRDEGEGREISVRGLGPNFTRVRINGIEALATTGSEDVSGGTNRSRAFDFNVFASELFSQITVHKSSSASLEEGSLGATVDLHTAHPFDYNKFTFVVNAQGGYNDLAGSFNPRAAALVSDTFLGGRLGVLFSAAYGTQNILEDGTSSVRFQNDNTNPTLGGGEPLVAGCVTNRPGTTNQCSSTTRFKSVVVTSILPGTNPAQVIGSVETVGAVPNGNNFNAATLPNNFDVVNEAFHPRFPRYDIIQNHSKRLGMTGSIQWQPDEDTLFTLDGMFADYAVERQEEYLEAPSFSTASAGANLAASISGAPLLQQNTLGIQSIGVLTYTVDPKTNNLVALTATDVGLRAEHRLDHLDTRFTLTTLDGTHTFSDQFKVHELIGWSESHHRNPIQTTLTMDYNTGPGNTGGAGTAAQPYSYNYITPDGKTPAISYGNVDVTNPTGWFLSQIRERAEYNFNSYRTAMLDAAYTPFNWLTLQWGFDWKNYGFKTEDLRRTDGSTATLDSYIPASIEATPLSQYTQLVHLEGLAVPAGTPTVWAVPSITKANALFNIFDPTAFMAVRPSGAAPCNVAPGCGAFQLGPQPALGSNGTVRENDTGGWIQAGWDTTVWGMSFRGDAGARFVNTQEMAQGFSFNPTLKAVVPTTVSQNYNDVLPSLNAVLEPYDDFLIRFNASHVLARPDLTNLLPGATVSKSGSNLTVKIGNPFLQPFRAKTLDLSFEWYYEKGALLSIAGFYKHIDDFVTSLNESIPYENNPFGLPDSLALAACGGVFTGTCNPNIPWLFTTPVNQKGSPLYGVEINWQQPFTFLPDPFSNLGILANVTYVQAQQTYFNTNGTIQAVADLQNLSRRSANATIYYDDGTFQARMSAAYRSKYIPNGGIAPGNLNDISVNGATFNLDASSSYKIDDNFTVSFQALNLTNQFQYQYVDSVGHRLLYNHQTGREFFLGLGYNY